MHPKYGAQDERIVNPLIFLQRFLVNLRGKPNILPSVIRLHDLAFFECLQQDGI